MALNQQSLHNFQSWDVDTVTRWLGQINLSHLVPIFEQYDVNGATLATMDESFMKEQLRIHRPGELMALRGAISTLIDQAAAHQRRGSGEPSRHGSLGKQSAATMLHPSASSSSPISSASSSSRTLPHNYTLSGEHPKVFKPTLKVVSAQELLDDSRHCGFITKQGGNYKSCTLCVCVCVCCEVPINSWAGMLSASIFTF